MLSWLIKKIESLKSFQPGSIFEPEPYPLLLFLDFDGVLHPHQRGTFEFIDNFQRILDIFPEAKVVISSSWRFSHSLKELQYFFDEPYRHRIIDLTPISERGDREEEILFFLKQKPAKHFIAIDDDRRLFPSNPSWLFVTPPAEGLNTHYVTLLITRLQKELGSGSLNQPW